MRSNAKQCEALSACDNLIKNNYFYHCHHKMRSNNYFYHCEAIIKNDIKCEALACLRSKGFLCHLGRGVLDISSCELPQFNNISSDMLAYPQNKK